MAAPETMTGSSERLERAAAKLKEARGGPFTPSALHAWLSALTDYALALGELHASLEERLQALGRPDLPRRAG